MRTITLLMSIALGAGAAACGGGPALGGVPHPNNAAMAGGVAAAAAAITLADPHAADRKPEQRTEEEKRPVDVKEQVPASALDRLDSRTGSGQTTTAAPAPTSDATSGADAGSAAKPAQVAKPAVPVAKPAAPAKTKATGKPPTLPSPHDAIDPDHADTR